MALTAKKVYAILKRQISDMEAKLNSPVRYRGTVATADLLPLNPDIGDMYNIESKSVYGEAGMNVAWNGVVWDTMGAPIDMSLYLTKEEAETVIQRLVTEYFEKNPVKPGATTEQAQQIEQNKTDIASLKTETGSLKEDLAYLSETKEEVNNLGPCATTSNTSYGNGLFLSGYNGWGTGIHIDNPISKIKIKIKASQSSVITCRICKTDYTELARATSNVGSDLSDLVFDFSDSSCVGDVLVLFSVPSGIDLGYASGFTLTNKYCLTRESDGKIVWYHLNSSGWGVWYELSQGTLFEVETKSQFLVPKTDNTLSNENLPSNAKTVGDKFSKMDNKISEICGMNYIYVSTEGNDTTGDGTIENPYATIYHANESITDNSKSKQYTIIVSNGTYTDLQDRYSGVIYQSGNGYQGIVCKDYVYYESEDITRPDLCVITWDGTTGLSENDRIVNNISPKCPFHVTSGVHTHIKGFRLSVKNCRYAMHIETVGNIGSTEWLIDHCIIEWYGTPDVTDSTYNRPVIGCGTTIGECGTISNSILCNYDDESKNNHGIMQTHDNLSNPTLGIKQGTIYKFVNCIFKTTKQYKAGFNMRDGTFSEYDSDNCIIFENCSGLGVQVGGSNTHWRSAMTATDVFEG